MAEADSANPGSGERADDGEAQRSQPRDSLLLRARVRSFDGDDAVEANVRNLSAGGMMAESDRVFPVGTRVQVELRNLDWVTGSVAWTVENRMGIAFESEIDPADARRPIKRAVHDDLIIRRPVIFRT